MLELIRRCKYCKREMMNVSAASWRENPFCQVCLPERMEKAADEVGPVRREFKDGYMIMTPLTKPVPMVLHCPECDQQHIDEGSWATHPHKTHQCQFCNHEWKPFDYQTVGVMEVGDHND